VTFLFVDRIFSIEPGKSIHAMKNATRNEGFYYWMPNGKRVLSPAVITEALAQAGAWLKMATFDFKKRPVLLADDITTLSRRGIRLISLSIFFASKKML